MGAGSGLRRTGQSRSRRGLRLSGAPGSRRTVGPATWDAPRRTIGYEMPARGVRDVACEMLYLAAADDRHTSNWFIQQQAPSAGESHLAALTRCASFSRAASCRSYSRLFASNLSCRPVKAYFTQGHSRCPRSCRMPRQTKCWPRRCSTHGPPAAAEQNMLCDGTIQVCVACLKLPPKVALR